MPKTLTIHALKMEVRNFVIQESAHPEPSMYGVTDGKAVGTYLEHKFQAYIRLKYRYTLGSSDKGMDVDSID